MRTRVKRQGFTLIELLLVIAILAILAGIILPKFVGRTEQARVAAAKTDVRMVETALDAFEVDVGRYPSSEEGLGALVEEPSGVKNWHGPYLKRESWKDPWGNPYQYIYPGAHSRSGYDLYSYGPDGHEGGGDDIDNWTQQ